MNDFNIQNMAIRVASLYLAKEKKKNKEKGVAKKYLSGMRGKNRKQRVNEINKRKKETDPKKKYKPFKSDEGRKPTRGQYSQTPIAQKIRDNLKGKGKDAFIEASSKASGVSKDILSDVFARGSAAWASGHRPGVPQFAWAIARVYSFLSGGKTQTTADRDLAEKAGLVGKKDKK